MTLTPVNSVSRALISGRLDMMFLRLTKRRSLSLLRPVNCEYEVQVQQLARMASQAKRTGYVSAPFLRCEAGLSARLARSLHIVFPDRQLPSIVQYSSD